jgi:hypothetical protein
MAMDSAFACPERIGETCHTYALGCSDDLLDNIHRKDDGLEAV